MTELKSRGIRLYLGERIYRKHEIKEGEYWLFRRNRMNGKRLGYNPVYLFTRLNKFKIKNTDVKNGYLNDISFFYKWKFIRFF